MDYKEYEKQELEKLNQIEQELEKQDKELYSNCTGLNIDKAIENIENFPIDRFENNMNKIHNELS
jgi:hypothetical protein